MQPRPLIIGFMTDKTIRHVLRTARRVGAEVDFLELAAFTLEGRVSACADTAEAQVECGNDSFRLEQASGIYQRVFVPPMDIVGVERWRDALARLSAINTALTWINRLVVNPPYAGWENGSKPLQAQRLSAAGFRTPRSLSTSRPDDYLRFIDGREVVFKSNSGIRSIVEDVRTLDPGRIELLPHSPVLLQERLRGGDVRVHVVGEKAYGLRIVSDAVDYRYYRERGSYSEMSVADDLPTEIGTRCASYARACGLSLAGFDFKVADGGWYCLEMNPSPAFESFDLYGGGLIAERLLQILAGRNP